MSRGSNSLKVQQWTDRLIRFRKSSLSVKRFCKNEGVSTASFYQWRRRLGSSHANAQDGNSSQDGSSKGFRTVRLTGNATRRHAEHPPVSDATLTIDLPGGIQIHVAAHRETIQTVFRELLDAGTSREERLS